MLRTIAALTVALLATTASAQTPLPDLFPDGSFVAPDVQTAKLESQIGRALLLGEARTHAGCIITLVSALARGASSGEADAAYDACRSGAHQSWMAYRDTTLADPSTPSCLDASALDTLHITVEAAMRLTMAHIFCEGAPATDALFSVPADSLALKHVRRVAQLVIAQASKEAKCTTAYAAALAKGAGDAASAAFDKCYYKSTLAAQTKIQQLYASSPGPACLPLSSALQLLGDHIGFPADLLAGLYCAGQ
jgi:hypothetical protein